MSIKPSIFTVAVLLSASAAAQSAASADSVFSQNGSAISRDVERGAGGAASKPATSSAYEAGNIHLGCPARGYRGFVCVNQTFGSLIIEGHDMGGYAQFGLLTSHGYQFSSHFFLGTGFGFLWQEGAQQRSEYDFVFSFFKDLISGGGDKCLVS